MERDRRPARAPTESGNAGSVDAPAHYDDHVDWYASFRRELDADEAAFIRTHLGSGSGRCLDLGCGTGVAFEVLASLGWTVVGSDVSEAMLERARGKGAELLAAPAERLPLETSSFDACVSLWTHTDVVDFTAALGEAFAFFVRVREWSTSARIRVSLGRTHASREPKGLRRSTVAIGQPRAIGTGLPSPRTDFGVGWGRPISLSACSLPHFSTPVSGLNGSKSSAGGPTSPTSSPLLRSNRIQEGQALSRHRAQAIAMIGTTSWRGITSTPERKAPSRRGSLRLRSRTASGFGWQADSPASSARSPQAR